MLSGCGTEERVVNLEKRLAAVEEKQRASEDAQKAKEDRQSKLEAFIDIDADLEYWNYIKLNGKPVPGKPGIYTAPTYQWDEAQKRKKEKVEECKVLYGK
jgi:hypothetical protein